MPAERNYSVIWSKEDNEYVGLCGDFPSLSWLAPTEEEAAAGIRKVVAEGVKFLAEGEPPVSVRQLPLPRFLPTSDVEHSLAAFVVE